MNELLEKDTKNYKDVTQEWLQNKITNKRKLLDAEYYEDDKGNKYYVDSHKVVLDYSKHELEVANWLINTFGGEIYMIPRVNSPDGISTPDYIWNGEKWDLKEIKGIGIRAIEDSIKRHKK